MIAKIAEGRNDGKSNFRTLLDYIVGKEKERAVYIGTRNIDIEDGETPNHREIAREMKGLALSNTRCEKPAFHFILSFRPHETPSREQVDEAVDIALKSLGLENCKSLYGLQNDNGISHVHVCVCRIDPNTNRAVDPGSGWSKKALSKAARQIEVTQGWEILENDKFWQVKNGKVVERSKKLDDKPKINDRAATLEAQTGGKSEQTIAIEKGADILRNASSWQELHDKLSEVGLEFRKKGSGAVVVVNGVLVKASSIGRDCSLKYLEKRIGEFYERNTETKQPATEVVDKHAEPTEQTVATPKTLSAWQRHQIYKRDHAELKEMRNALFAEQKEHRAQLQKRQKEERDALYRSRPTWKEAGKILNYERMLLASQQLQKRLLLRERQKNEREKFPVLPKFLPYRKWLAENQPEVISDIRNWRQENSAEQNVLQIYKPDDDENNPLKIKGIKAFALYIAAEISVEAQSENRNAMLKNFAAYQARRNSDNKTLSYCLQDGKTAFIEKKDGITVIRNNSSSLLAAMQLAQSKWGLVKLEGTKKNLDICMKLAEEFNIKIQVPEKYLEQWKKEQEAQKVEKAIEKDTDIFEVCATGTAEDVKKALRGEDPNQKDEQGMTLLMIAAERNPNAGVITLLVNTWGDINVGSTTPLMFAAESNPNPAVIDEILDARAKINTINSLNQNAAFNAIYNPNFEVAKKVIDSGIDMNLKNSNGQTPVDFLMTAVENQHIGPERVPKLVKLYTDATIAQNVEKAKFTVKITESLTDSYEIEATSEEEATQMARESYERDEIGPTIETSRPFATFEIEGTKNISQTEENGRDAEKVDTDLSLRLNFYQKMILEDVRKSDLEEVRSRIVDLVPDKTHPIRKEARTIMSELNDKPEWFGIDEETASKMVKLLLKSVDYENEPKLDRGR